MDDGGSVSLIREAWATGDRLVQEGKHHDAILTLAKAKAALLAEKQSIQQQSHVHQRRSKYTRLLDTLFKELSSTLDAEVLLMHRNPCLALQLDNPPRTIKALKIAYHKMARQYHPDRNANQNAAEVFACVQNAYEVLSAKLHHGVDVQQGEAPRKSPSHAAPAPPSRTSQRPARASDDDLLSRSQISEVEQLSLEELLLKLRAKGIKMSPQTRKPLLIQLYLGILKSDAKRAQKRASSGVDARPDPRPSPPKPQHSTASETPVDQWSAATLWQKSLQELRSIMRLRGIPSFDCVEKLDMIEKILRMSGSKEALDQVRPQPPTPLAHGTSGPAVSHNEQSSNILPEYDNEHYSQAHYFATAASVASSKRPSATCEAEAEPPLPPPGSRISPALVGSPIHLGEYLVSEDEADSNFSDVRDSDNSQSNFSGDHGLSDLDESGGEELAETADSSQQNSRPDTSESQQSRFVQSLRRASKNCSSPSSGMYGILDDGDEESMPRHIPQLSSDHARDIQEEVEFWATPRVPIIEGTAQTNASVEEDRGWFWGGTDATK